MKINFKTKEYSKTEGDLYSNLILINSFNNFKEPLELKENKGLDWSITSNNGKNLIICGTLRTLIDYTNGLLYGLNFFKNIKIKTKEEQAEIMFKKLGYTKISSDKICIVYERKEFANESIFITFYLYKRGNDNGFSKVRVMSGRYCATYCNLEEFKAIQQQIKELGLGE